MNISILQGQKQLQQKPILQWNPDVDHFDTELGIQRMRNLHMSPPFLHVWLQHILSRLNVHLIRVKGHLYRFFRTAGFGGMMAVNSLAGQRIRMQLHWRDAMAQLWVTIRVRVTRRSDQIEAWNRWPNAQRLTHFKEAYWTYDCKELHKLEETREKVEDFKNICTISRRPRAHASMSGVFPELSRRLWSKRGCNDKQFIQYYTVSSFFMPIPNQKGTGSWCYDTLIQLSKLQSQSEMIMSSKLQQETFHGWRKFCFNPFPFSEICKILSWGDLADFGPNEASSSNGRSGRDNFQLRSPILSQRDEKE